MYTYQKILYNYFVQTWIEVVAQVPHNSPQKVTNPKSNSTKILSVPLHFMIKWKLKLRHFLPNKSSKFPNKQLPKRKSTQVQQKELSCIAQIFHMQSTSDQVRISILKFICYIFVTGVYLKMSDLSQANTNSLVNKPPKTKEEYSRNVKKLKIKLQHIEEEIEAVSKKMKAFSNTSNDKMIALKISKFCKERRMTPEMLFRCADRARSNNIPKSAFKQTLTAFGIKLTQHQLTRLEYLLDQDISGEISLQQYNAYLIAFGIKGQYSADELFLKDALKKVDHKKLLDEIDDKNPEKKYKQLLNYEQFLKYCHRHLPQLKDKEIAAIFNILHKNNLIDLNEFLDYIKRRDEQQKKIDQKNKRISRNDSMLSNPDQANSLKGIIKLILKNRPKDSKALFHTLQFIKVERILNKNRGQLLQMFKQIDRKKRGSFGFAQLIQFYIEKQKQRDILFAYQLMGRKMLIDKQYPEDVIGRYNGGSGAKKINIEQFKTFMKKQFDVVQSDAEAVFRALSKEDNQITVKKIIDAMKLQQGQKKLVYIKPTAWKTEHKDFWKKGCFTILFNPFVALRFCLQISDQLRKVGQTSWDDFEFGPIFEDPYGIDSLGFDNINAQEIKWLTVQSLGMSDFYTSISVSGDEYQSSTTCPNEIFPKVLCDLKNQSQQFLWSREKVDYSIKDLQQHHLRHLFEGVYPIIFHQFALLGIYVFRFFVRERWAYVMVDNKIPCNNENLPMFCHAKGIRTNWISLIEKAYAKIKGSYYNLYTVNSIQQYIYELNRKLPITEQVPSQKLDTPQQKNKLWARMLELQNQRRENKLYSLVTDLVAHQLIQNKQQTGIIKNKLNQIANFVEISDPNTQNFHKSHRLILMKNLKLKNEPIWNPNWNTSQDINKYDKFLVNIDAELKNKQSAISLLKDNNGISILNYKLFRNIFNEIMHFKKVSFENMIVLRKVVEFEQKFVCKYQLNSKKPNKEPIIMIITLNRIKSSDNTQIELCLKDSKGIEIQKQKLSKIFGVFQFKIGAETNQILQTKVLNWNEGQDHVYSLTFYMESPLYHLKQLDRQILFNYVSPYQQTFFLDIKLADEVQRKHIYRNYFRAAERGGGCCG